METNQRLSTLSNQLTQSQPIYYESNQQILTITINRPKLLNAFNLQMINNLLEHLPVMNQHQIVWIQGAGGKSFSSGGDLKELFGKSSTVQKRLTFFRNEATLDYKMSQLKAIQISCWDGIVMGSGIGISVHSPVIIATEKTVFAMPQAKNGSFTGVGANYVFSRLRNNIGYYLGITGASLKGEDVFIAGLAHFFIPSCQINTAFKEIVNAFSEKVGNPKAVVEKILAKYHSPSGRKLIQNEQKIQQLFRLRSIKEIYLKAITQTDQFHKNIAQIMKNNCPASMELIARLIAMTEKMTLKQCLARDYLIDTHMAVSLDFMEGVRCLIIEKGSVAVWSCQDLLKLTDQEVDKFFKPPAWFVPLQLE